MTGRTPIVVLGAGPAGVGAARQLARRDEFAVTVIERHGSVGGNAGSFVIDDIPVDYGSHRLHPAVSPEILRDIRAMLGDDLLDRPRHGRIRLRGRWVGFPLKPVDLALHLPPSFIGGVLMDGLRKRRTEGAEESFGQVLERGLGRTICRDFYFPYAIKMWGQTADALDGEQARRRVSAGSLTKMIRRVLSAVPGLKPKGAGRFFYPRRGYGQISEAYHRSAVEHGAMFKFNTELNTIEVEAGQVTAVVVRGAGGTERLAARHVLSTIPLPALIHSIAPAAPKDVTDSAAALRSRAMILVYLVVATDRFTEFDAHYFPGPEVPFTRMHEPKNYSLTEQPGATVLCIELPCSTTDAVWSASDEELQGIVTSGLAAIDLPVRSPIRRVVTRRLREAYPIYLRGYQEHFNRLDRWISGIGGLLTLGRQGLFAHDNTHHTLAMAYAASECLDASGSLDQERWAEYRHAFESHVVED